MSQIPADTRPLSPHLSIYKFTWLMMASIIHRMTGAALYFGTLLVLWGLLALNLGPEAYQFFFTCAHSLAGKLVLFGYTWALMHHALGGVRHLIWDTGRGLSVPVAKKLAIANFIGSIALTCFIWFLSGAFA
jgi:succinate dehydrogenase / fumarate reductase cytochrome b subunit